MKKTLWVLFTVFCVLTAACSNDDKDDTPAAVGILDAKIAPQGSTVQYSCAIDQTTLKIENTADSVQWDVTDACLQHTTLTVSTTLGGTAYLNGAAIGADGVTIDATKPVTLEVRDGNGQSKTYTLTVVRANTATGDDMMIKASAFNGFPSGIIDYDIACFNNKFYATVTSLSGEIENYQLFSSEDGISWSEVDYKTSDSTDGYVIGGEGACMVVFNNKLHIMGGARTKGSDKYGNAAETSWGMATISAWRSYSTSDGVTFACDTTGMKYINGDTEYPSSYMACTQMSFAELNGKLYMNDAYYMAFGMAQGKGLYACTSNGKDWTALSLTADDETSINYTGGGAFFSFKGKLWKLGGYKSYISAANMVNAVYSSADGETWVKAGELPENMAGLYGMKVVVNDEVAFMFGGEFVTANGNILSDKIFRSTDGVNWTETAVSASYTARRNAKAVAIGNTAWVFGGITTGISGSYYNYPSDTDVLGTDTWVKLMK